MSASVSSRPRRRRDGSAVQRTPRQLQQGRRRRRAGTAEVLAATAIAVICAALIALIWINTERAVREQADDTSGRVEAAITAQAATLAIQVQHELQMIDQSLTILQAAWNNDPTTFSLAKWHKIMPVLTGVADDLFIVDDRQLIVQDILPAAVGQRIGSAYATFANGSLEAIRLGSDNGMLVGDLGSGGVVRHYMVYMVRPLKTPIGWFVGASYKSTALTAVFASAGLGQGGLAALIDTQRGGAQAVAGTAALRPRVDINKTPLYAAMLARPDGGVWVGRTPIDDVQRLVAFRRVPGRDLIVLVGVERDQALAPADTWAAAARTLATIATLLVLAIGAALLWELWHWRRTRHRQRTLVQVQELLPALQGDLAATRAKAATSAAQVEAILGDLSEGVAVIDGEQRLAAWNPSFAALSGLPQEALRDAVPFDDLLRQQALAGRFGTLEDVEAEIARRIALLRPEAGMGELVETGPDGTSLVLRAQPMPDGGLVLILHPAGGMPAAAHAEERTNADPVEW